MKAERLILKKIKKYIPEIISMIIPIIIICIGCLFTNTKPFGEYLLAKYDGLSQYASFTINFKNVLLGKNSLFYSFGGSLGYNFYATSIYYMFNPTNILCLFATKNAITIPVSKLGKINHIKRSKVSNSPKFPV